MNSGARKQGKPSGTLNSGARNQENPPGLLSSESVLVVHAEVEAVTLDVTDDDDQKADRNTQVEGAAAGQKLQLQSGFFIQKGIQSVEQKVIRNSHSSRNRHAHGADGGVDLRGENLADIAEDSALSKIDEGRNDRLRETLQKSEGKGDKEDLSFSADDAEAAAVVGQNAVQLILPVFVLLYPTLLRQPVNDAAADPLALPFSEGTQREQQVLSQ